MTDCPFKAGQTYRTRDGREALIYCTDAPGDHPIHGRVHGFPYAHSWTAEGMCYSDFRFRDDLVPPVPAPPPRIRGKYWCNVTREGHVIVWGSEESARQALFPEPIRVAVPCELVEIVEGEA